MEEERKGQNDAALLGDVPGVSKEVQVNPNRATFALQITKEENGNYRVVIAGVRCAEQNRAVGGSPAHQG